MKTLGVVDPQRGSACQDCINACHKVHGVARVKKTSTIPLFCLHCHPDKASCAKICPTGAIREDEGTLIGYEDACLHCRLCMIACPVGMLVIDEEKKSVHKCTLCLDVGGALPACVDAC
ncbi:MAG: 4Fe-4S dicluster domain-containing protein [Methanobacteriaceae archaeon]|nr:4Fe-4S dicluster domain-containing protein [Methanobacteriaceae archaeon]